MRRPAFFFSCVVLAAPAAWGATVRGFEPQTGPVGTHVKVTGEGFTDDMKVLMGGHFVALDEIQPNVIKFTVPARTGDGLLSLRQPGAGNDVTIGQFTVILPAQLVGFAPAAGPPGTRVELTGTGFAAGDRIVFDGQPLPALEQGPARILVEIPAGARSDVFTLTRGGANQSLTSRRFLVTLPPPSVTGFSPPDGPPGTTVHVTGSGFAPDDGVFYGQAQLAIAARTADGVDVVIPAHATRAETLVVRGPRGESATAAPFGLLVNPTVERFAPAFGPPGTRVNLWGAHWRAEDRVKLDGQDLPVVSVDEGHVQVTIPPNAKSDAFVVERRGRVVATAATPFAVVCPPAIVGFNPPGGPAGTAVTITGTAFGADARVLYGPDRVPIATRAGEQSITVAIPDGATDQPFTVVTRAGQSTSASPFQVYVYSTIDAIAPTSGTIGAHVTIRGRHHGHDRFFLGAVELPIVEKQPDASVVETARGDVGVDRVGDVGAPRAEPVPLRREHPAGADELRAADRRPGHDRPARRRELHEHDGRLLREPVVPDRAPQPAEPALGVDPARGGRV